MAMNPMFNTAAECPFCESTLIVVDEIDRNEYAAVCQQCGAIGPCQPTLAQAVTKWNRGALAKRLCHDMLDPEMYGHAVTQEVRDAARRALKATP